MWTLMIVAISGSFISSNATIQTLPFSNKEACLTAIKTLVKESRGIDLVCVSAETGEMIKFKT